MQLELIQKFSTVINSARCCCSVDFGYLNAACGCSARTVCDLEIKLRFVSEVLTSASIHNQNKVAWKRVYKPVKTGE